MWLIVILGVLSFSVEAEIFQWFDENGNKHFSDKPHQGAKRFQLNESYSYYRIKKIYDGDTLLLMNGQKVRLLGINTPEVEGRNKSSQAGGEEAKQWLIARLKKQKIRVETDVEKKDKYGRLLAHVFTEDKQHINLELVGEGLASINVYPPNLKYINELLKAEHQAEQKIKGIWGEEAYAIKLVENIKSGSFKGWQRISGTVKSVHHARKNSYLKFSDYFSLKIAKKSFKFFPELESYIGKKLEVRGWINRYKNKYSLFVRHSSAIKEAG